LSKPRTADASVSNVSLTRRAAAPDEDGWNSDAKLCALVLLGTGAVTEIGRCREKKEARLTAAGGVSLEGANEIVDKLLGAIKGKYLNVPCESKCSVAGTLGSSLALGSPAFVPAAPAADAFVPSLSFLRPTLSRSLSLFLACFSAGAAVLVVGAIASSFGGFDGFEDECRR
jgi:hypothetical protein